MKLLKARGVAFGVRTAFSVRILTAVLFGATVSATISLVYSGIIIVSTQASGTFEICTVLLP